MGARLAVNNNAPAAQENLDNAQGPAPAGGNAAGAVFRIRARDEEGRNIVPDMPIFVMQPQ